MLGSDRSTRPSRNLSGEVARTKAESERRGAKLAPRRRGKRLPGKATGTFDPENVSAAQSPYA
ncbi:MAG: hypothetical protein EA381_21115 [Planctomycetaceae bacterium]|nr:MAG: hypothetical protein EA381_21115 [Planctomycetaceae bacterium]